jgi:hypothetical protein
MSQIVKVETVYPQLKLDGSASWEAGDGGREFKTLDAFETAARGEFETAIKRVMTRARNRLIEAEHLRRTGRYSK